MNFKFLRILFIRPKTEKERGLGQARKSKSGHCLFTHGGTAILGRTIASYVSVFSSNRKKWGSKGRRVNMPKYNCYHFVSIQAHKVVVRRTGQLTTDNLKRIRPTYRTDNIEEMAKKKQEKLIVEQLNPTMKTSSFLLSSSPFVQSETTYRKMFHFLLTNLEGNIEKFVLPSFELPIFVASPGKIHLSFFPKQAKSKGCVLKLE